VVYSTLFIIHLIGFSPVGAEFFVTINTNYYSELTAILFNYINNIVFFVVDSDLFFFA